MPDSIADIAEPKVQGELDGLRLLVEETEGNVIAFVRYERVTEREAGIRYLKEHLSIPVVERVLSGQRQNPLALLDNLPEERCCVQLYDLEAALPEIAGYLNVNREAYADVPHALVFWVGEHGLREIAQNAPDFWAWRSGVFDVRSEGVDLTRSISQVALAGDVQFTNRGDLERRAQLYEGLIGEYEGEDEEYVARLRLKHSAVLYWLRRLERAHGEALRAKEYAEREGDEKTAGQAYHQLGIIAQERWDFEEAKTWHEKAVEIFERQGDQHEAAHTYGQMGILAAQQDDFVEAGRCLIQSVTTFSAVSDEQGAQRNASNFLLAFHQAPRNQREEMREMWIDAGLPPEPLEDRTEQVQAEHND
jgi:tetratricopeptide (TPR) repeat protein